MTTIRRSFLSTLVLGLFIATAYAGEPAPADVVDTLKQLAPANVIVERVEFLDGSDKRFQISGRADRNATVSDYLRAIDTAESFQKTELVQIMLDANGHPSFEIMVERAPVVSVEASSDKAKAPTTTTPAKPKVYRCTVDGREMFQSVPCPPSPR